MHLRKITPFLILMTFIAVLIQVGCDTLVTEVNNITLVDSTLGSSCYKCHSVDDVILLRPRGQFDNSAHANHSQLDVIDKECEKCHSHEGFLTKVDSSLASYKAPSAINCFTCHLPHTRTLVDENIDTLRTQEKTTVLVSNLGRDLGQSNQCAHCHSATQRLVEDQTGDEVLDENFGPHNSSQADIVVGRNAYYMDSIINNDATTYNKHFVNGCISCHYGGYGEGQGYTFAEHTFRLEDQNTLTQYNNTCIKSGCHVGADPEMIDFYSSPMVMHIDTLSLQVKSLLDEFEIIDLSEDTSGLTFTVNDTIPRMYAESYYNFLLYKNDGSRGIHNLTFVKALLERTSITLDSLPPISGFTVVDAEGCVDSLTEFIPQIRGIYDSLKWDFGDNTPIVYTDQDSTVSHTFASEGTYSVSLVAISNWRHDSLGTGASYDTLMVEDLMIIDSEPIPEFSLADSTQDTICSGTMVAFTNNTTHTASALFTWDFGHGETDTSSGAITHVFDTIGTLDVSLTAETKCGDSTITKPAFITVNGSYIDFHAVDTTLCMGDSAYFVNSSVENITGTYNLKPGFGTPINDITDTTAVEYATPGVYTITVDFISSGAGCGTITKSKLAYIVVDGVTATLPNPSNVDSVYTFLANITGNADSLKWDFNGDGTIDDTTSTAPWTYTYSPGTYNPLLIVYNDNCSIIDSATVTVNVP